MNCLLKKVPGRVKKAFVGGFFLTFWLYPGQRGPCRYRQGCCRQVSADHVEPLVESWRSISQRQIARFCVANLRNSKLSRAIPALNWMIFPHDLLAPDSIRGSIGICQGKSGGQRLFLSGQPVMSFPDLV